MASEERIAAMAALFTDGWTMQEVGDEYGVTKQRVQQLLKRVGLGRGDGGQAKTVADRVADDLAVREERCMRLHGCSLDQLDVLKALSPSGKGRERTPIGAFAVQRSNARKRGIAWNLKLWEWWTIWQESGRWGQRGRCADEYVMCRQRDMGGYSVENVYIDTASQNIKDFYRVHGDRHAVKMMLSERYHRGRTKPPVSLPHIRGLVDE